jgi:hypothetical protein
LRFRGGGQLEVDRYLGRRGQVEVQLVVRESDRLRGREPIEPRLRRRAAGCGQAIFVDCRSLDGGSERPGVPARLRRFGSDVEGLEIRRCLTIPRLSAWKCIGGGLHETFLSNRADLCVREGGRKEQHRSSADPLPVRDSLHGLTHSAGGTPIQSESLRCTGRSVLASSFAHANDSDATLCGLLHLNRWRSPGDLISIASMADRYPLNPGVRLPGFSPRPCRGSS